MDEILNESVGSVKISYWNYGQSALSCGGQSGTEDDENADDNDGSEG